jgi:hypothetical protein
VLPILQKVGIESTRGLRMSTSTCYYAKSWDLSFSAAAAPTEPQATKFEALLRPRAAGVQVCSGSLELGFPAQAESAEW